MSEVPVRYQSADEDSARWNGFEFRPGDIVISTRSKSGTTWMQVICALLIFGSADLPAPISRLSPWLDHLVRPRDEVFEQLARQRHRRFIKSHTPLDGIPFDPRVTYIVVGRHPLDSAVSLYHQGGNIDRPRWRQLTGQPEPEQPEQPAPPRPPAREWLLSWIGDDPDPREQLDSLPGVLWHASDAWHRRARPNIVLAHYHDLSVDLEGEMRRLATLLSVTVPDQLWPTLAGAASFTSMRAAAEQRIPDKTGMLRSSAAFFRRGTSGAGAELLTGNEIAAYDARAARLAPADLLTWLHRPGPGHQLAAGA